MLDFSVNFFYNTVGGYMNNGFKVFVFAAFILVFLWLLALTQFVDELMNAFNDPGELIKDYLSQYLSDFINEIF